MTLAEKKARLKAVDDLQATIQTETNLKLLDQTFDVLLEGTTRGKSMAAIGTTSWCTSAKAPLAKSSRSG